MKRTKMMNKMRGFFIQFRRQTKGIISLFLALTLLPFSSFAILITESARFQNVAELLEEIIDGSAFSSIADYDPYLEKRFDLLATGQKTNVTDNFSQYMNNNMDAIGKNATLKYAKAEGEYALSDPDILKAQIIENCGIEVTTEFLEDVGDLDEFLKKLKKSFGGDLKLMVDSMDAIEKSVDIAKDISEVLECMKETVEVYDYYAEVKNTYMSKATAFESAVLQIPKALETAEKEIKEKQAAQNKTTENEKESTSDSASSMSMQKSESIETDPYKHENVIKTINAAETAADEYESAASTLLKKFDDFTKKYIKMHTVINELPKKFSKANEAYNKLSKKDEAVSATFHLMREIMAALTKVTAGTVTDVLNDKVTEGKNQLSAQIEILRMFSGKSVIKEWTHDTLVQNHYTPIVLQVEPQLFKNDIEIVIQEIKNLIPVSGIDEGSLADLLDLMNKFMGINFLYDESLKARVPENVLFARTNMNWSSQAVLMSMQILITSISDFADSIDKAVKGTLNLNLLDVLTGVVNFVKSTAELLGAVVAFIGAVIAWTGDVLVGVSNLISDGVDEGLITSLILAGYAGYNLPNRTTCYSGKSLNEYSYSEIFSAAGGSYKTSAAGSLFSLVSTKDLNEVSSESQMFMGAEGEYILIGSQNEIQNQMAAAFNLYMVRLILNAFLLFDASDPEMKALVSSVSISAWVIKVAILLVEPMLDVIILQNGGEQFFFKDNLYLSPQGIIKLAKDLVNASDINEMLRAHLDDKITDKAEEKVDPYDDDGMHKSKKDIDDEIEDLTTMNGKFQMDYTEYLIIMILLMTSNDKIVERLQNIIQMEAKTQEKTTNDFSLDRAYTYIKTDVEAELNPMFRIDGLSDNGVFTVRRSQYVGY